MVDSDMSFNSLWKTLWGPWLTSKMAQLSQMKTNQRKGKGCAVKEKHVSCGGLKRLTHAVSTRPAGATLSTVLAIDEEVVTGTPRSVVTPPAVLKDAAT